MLSASLREVAARRNAKLRESAWRKMAMRLEISTALRSVYPYREPPPRSVAQFPGSM
jgi:hypothetical protein